MDTVYEGIVLRSINYSESSIIVKVYTLQSGLKSFIVKGARSKSKKNLLGLFQPLSAVEIVSSSSKSAASLSHLKEIKSRYQFKELHLDPYKIGVVFFIAEILDKSLKEEESNQLLFEFLDKSIHFFDDLEDYSNFHIYFLLELSKYLGFYPLIKDPGANYFDMESGILEKTNKTYSGNYSQEILNLLEDILGMNFVDRWQVVLKRSQRTQLLDLLIDYYKSHIQGVDKLKSLKILQNLFI